MSADIVDFRSIQKKRNAVKKKDQEELDSSYSLEAIDNLFSNMFEKAETDPRSADEIAGEMLYFLVNDLIFKGFNIHSDKNIPADLSLIGISISTIIHRMRGKKTDWMEYLDGLHEEDPNVKTRVQYWLALQDLARENNS